ncbi:MAG: cbb3-type cytochrome c oxidase subunit I, partial [Gammaproteobacteria bacterium]
MSADAGAVPGDGAAVPGDGAAVPGGGARRADVDTPPGRASYLEDGYTFGSWLTSHDHKRIAILYAISITSFFFIGGLAATLIRIELATPAGDLVSHDTYNKLFTAHG